MHSLRTLFLHSLSERIEGLNLVKVITSMQLHCINREMGQLYVARGKSLLESWGTSFLPD